MWPSLRRTKTSICVSAIYCDGDRHDGQERVVEVIVQQVESVVRLDLRHEDVFAVGHHERGGLELRVDHLHFFDARKSPVRIQH